MAYRHQLQVRDLPATGNAPTIGTKIRGIEKAFAKTGNGRLAIGVVAKVVVAKGRIGKGVILSMQDCNPQQLRAGDFCMCAGTTGDSDHLRSVPVSLST